MNIRKVGWSDIIAYVIIVLTMVAGFAYVEQSRKDSTRDGRLVLCQGIIANTNNVARDNTDVVRICRDVGVDRQDYPPTRIPQ